VLVVDDNRDAADGLAMLLRLDGHEVEAVYSGEGVVDTVRRFEPDCVLLDIGLPRVDGYEIARQLRALPDGARRTLVAITGYGQHSDVSAAYAAGFDAHAVKPADFTELNSIMARHSRAGTATPST
jgi:CheY-like chemotaxis protein